MLTAPTKLEIEAMTLFQVKTADAVRSCMYALGLREICSRCLGSGHYSRNSFGSTVCYKCNGRKAFAAKLTRKVLDAARAKVEAGDLAVARARAAERSAARKSIKAQLEAERAASTFIADAYMDGSRVVDGNRTWCDRSGPLTAFVASPLFRAREMSVSIGRVAFEASLAVEFHGADPVRAVATIDACAAMQLDLAAAWRAWELAQRTKFRAAARSRLAA